MRHHLSAFSIVAGSVMGLAGAAPAQELFFGRTVGSLTFSDREPPILSGTLEQFFITFKGPVTFETLLMTFEIVQEEPKPDAMSGAFTFFGTDPANSLSGTFSGISFPNEDGIWTGAGFWTTSMGTGAFEGLSGEGKYSVALTVDGGEAATAFNGTIVPAPAGALCFGAMLAANVRRRRSAFR
jgi:hypothetical protein